MKKPPEQMMVRFHAVEKKGNMRNRLTTNTNLPKRDLAVPAKPRALPIPVLLSLPLPPQPLPLPPPLLPSRG